MVAFAERIPLQAALALITCVTYSETESIPARVSRQWLAGRPGDVVRARSCLVQTAGYEIAFLYRPSRNAPYHAAKHRGKLGITPIALIVLFCGPLEEVHVWWEPHIRATRIQVAVSTRKWGTAGVVWVYFFVRDTGANKW